MSASQRGIVDPLDRLPDITLPGADGVPVRLRARGRRATLLLLVHAPGCAACGAFVQGLEAEADEIEAWDGRPLIVQPEPGPAAAAPAPGRHFPLLSDPDARVSTALSVRPPALVLADQWGEVHLRHEAGEDHRFPTVAEIVEWLRFLAIQCPECQGEAF